MWREQSQPQRACITLTRGKSDGGAAIGVLMMGCELTMAKAAGLVIFSCGNSPLIRESPATARFHNSKECVRMAKTLIQRLWSNVTELKVLLECTNPHVPVAECKTLLAEMELKVKTLRRRELRNAH